MYNETLDFSGSLLYPQNNHFIEGYVPEPYNAREIRAHLDQYFGPLPSRFTLWHVGIVGVIQLVINCGFALAFLYGGMHLLRIRRLSIYLAAVVAFIGFLIGAFVTNEILKQLPRGLYRVSRYTEAERKSVYKVLCKDAEVVNGTLVDVTEQGRETIMTYTVKTPTYDVIRRTFKTQSAAYTRADVGREVAVLYLNESINVLL